LLGRVLADGSTELEELIIDDERLATFERVLLVACGSSYHAALVGRSAFESLAGLPADVDIASEFRYRSAHLGPETLVITVSQSGETRDTFHALKQAKALGATVIAVTNVLGSLMEREADGVCYTRAGLEVGVASTKCHLAQLTLLEVMALHIGRVRGVGDQASRSAFAGQLLALPQLVEQALADVSSYHEVARRFADVEDFYFLGRRLGFPIALEGALKLKELAYVRAEAYPAGEMKHGPIALIEPGAVVVAIANRTPMWEKVMSNIEEMRARGASIIAVADAGDSETASLVDAVLAVPPTSELCSPVVSVVPLQCFAYEIAIARGNDVDRPRNLAKVVTVE
jgi:glucosamine--fructose-6-phosphate aminotransferase (isomerizing)